MYRVGKRQKAVGRGALAAWAVVLAFPATAGAQTPSADATPVPVSAELGLKITLRVYNYAHISKGLLSRSEEESGVIFRQAGVETAWIDCPLSPAELDRFPACQQTMGRADFALRILSAAMTQKGPGPR
jgi:hypothetical protein